MKRVTRERRLTVAEAVRHEEIRNQVDLEKPKFVARIRGRLASRWKVIVAQKGGLTLNQRIRCGREARRPTQVELALAAGTSPGYLSQLEQDEREPTLSIAVRLAAALGISLDDLAAGAA